MKIDKKTIDTILKLNDEQLWHVIRSVAKKSGVTPLSSTEMPKNMDSIRKTLSSLNDQDIERAIEKLKRGQNNG